MSTTIILSQITPGKRSPTVSKLEMDNWVAVQSLVRRMALEFIMYASSLTEWSAFLPQSCIYHLQVKRKESNLKMDQLHDVGATDILLFPISNSRM